MIDEPLYRQYLPALIAGDRQRCADMVIRLLNNEVAAETLYTALFQRALYEVGDLWEHNHISVAVEHLATALTEYLLSMTFPRILANRSGNGRRAVVSCAVNEYHQVGARMVADILESRGWDVWFVGANTPVESLLALIQEKKPEVLGLSVSIYFNMVSLVKMIQTVRAHFAQLDIIVGGQAFRWGGAEMIKPFVRTECIPTLAALIQTLSPGKPS